MASGPYTSIMRAQRTDRRNKPYEAATPQDTTFQPQANIDPQAIAQDEREIRTESHLHDGMDSPRLALQSLIGLIEVVSTVPTGVPKTFFQQVKLYSNGGTRRVYFYVTDSVGSGAWRYATLT